jgi:hypothetical protein
MTAPSAPAVTESLVSLCDALLEQPLRAGERHDVEGCRDLLAAEPHRPLARSQLERLAGIAARRLGAL